MRIRRHKKSHIVELADHSVWRIWPADIPKTLLWLRRTDLELTRIEHEVCTHALLDRATGVAVRVIDGGARWPVDRVRRLLASPDRADNGMDGSKSGRRPPATGMPPAGAPAAWRPQRDA